MLIYTLVLVSKVSRSYGIIDIYIYLYLYIYIYLSKIVRNERIKIRSYFVFIFIFKEKCQLVKKIFGLCSWEGKQPLSCPDHFMVKLILKSFVGVYKRPLEDKIF